MGESWYDFDAEAAKALLAEAGFPDGFETTITYRDVVRAYLPQPSVVAQDIQAQLLENLNIKPEIVVMESGAFLDAADSGIIEGLHLLGWNADYPDMTNFLDYHFGSGSSKQFGEKFTDLTDVLKQAASLNGDDLRKPLYEQANALIKRHVPMVNATSTSRSSSSPRARRRGTRRWRWRPARIALSRSRTRSRICCSTWRRC